MTGKEKTKEDLEVDFTKDRDTQESTSQGDKKGEGVDKKEDGFFLNLPKKKSCFFV